MSGSRILATYRIDHPQAGIATFLRHMTEQNIDLVFLKTEDGRTFSDARLVEERLSDGSKVYSLVLS